MSEEKPHKCLRINGKDDGALAVWSLVNPHRNGRNEDNESDHSKPWSLCYTNSNEKAVADQRGDGVLLSVSSMEREETNDA